MATETWPGTLPDTPDKSGYNYVGQDNTISSSVGYGPVKKRRRSTISMAKVNMQMTLTESEVTALRTFYETTLGTTQPFNWTDHTTGSAAVYRFVSPPSLSYFAPGYWLVKLALEIVPL